MKKKTIRKIPSPNTLLQMNNISLSQLEPVVNLSIKGRLMCEAMQTLPGVKDFQMDLNNPMLDYTTIYYIIYIGKIWFKNNPKKKKSFDDLVSKTLMYPDFDVMIKIKKNTVYKKHQLLWKSLQTWGQNSKLFKENGEWNFETCFQEWNKVMYHMEESKDSAIVFWQYYSKYGNFLARVLIYFMKVSKKPMGLYHLLLLPAIYQKSSKKQIAGLGQSIRVKLFSYVNSLFEGKHIDDDDKYKEITQKWLSIKEKSVNNKVTRKDLPLEFYKFEGGKIEPYLVSIVKNSDSKKTKKSKLSSFNFSDSSSSSEF